MTSDLVYALALTDIRTVEWFMSRHYFERIDWNLRQHQ